MLEKLKKRIFYYPTDDWKLGIVLDYRPHDWLYLDVYFSKKWLFILILSIDTRLVFVILHLLDN